jgi:4-hydroxy-4-methyl-2-oxoglutarate aldolase
MTDFTAFAELSPTDFANVVTQDRVVDLGIRPLWSGMARIAGPAYTVRCPAGDNLMLHAAIYRAAPGSVVVVEAGDTKYAVAGGNVCAVAQRHGIAAFLVDGVIRDVAESRENKFPIFARGVVPIPGAKETLGELNVPIVCGGVVVSPGDIVVADEEGIVIIERESGQEVLERAQAIAAVEAATSLESWESAHTVKIEQLLREKGFTG